MLLHVIDRVYADINIIAKLFTISSLKWVPFGRHFSREDVMYDFGINVANIIFCEDWKKKFNVWIVENFS